MGKFTHIPSTRFKREGPKNPSLHSYGLSSPKSGALAACLCANRKTYSKECCKGYLINQGIGNTITPYPTDHPYAFSKAFSSAFE